jgi:hypothetical protein
MKGETEGGREGTVSFIITLKIIKYSGISSIKKAHTLYSENYKYSERSQEDLNNWENNSGKCSEMENLLM